MTASPATAAQGTAPAGDPGAAASWRIDDLAQRAGVAVDTIRYYQREDLLPPAVRSGRTNLYGPGHLERLERIKELQGRRFSLAAIRALLTADREALFEGFFADRAGGRYSLDDLFTRSGLDARMGTRLRELGLLRDPVEHGREAYDADDLDLVRALAELRQLGFSEDVVIELARIYTEGLEATEREIVALFTTGGSLEWKSGDFAAFQDFAARYALEFLPLARRMLDYIHNRTLQRLTLGALERGGRTPPPGSDDA